MRTLMTMSAMMLPESQIPTERAPAPLSTPASEIRATRICSEIAIAKLRAFDADTITAGAPTTAANWYAWNDGDEDGPGSDECPPTLRSGKAVA